MTKAKYAKLSKDRTYSAVTESMNNSVKNTIDSEIESMLNGDYDNKFINLNLQCSRYHCKNKNEQAQCTDPIHEDLDFQCVKSNMFIPPNNRMKVNSVTGSSATRSTEPQTRCKLDLATNETWIIFDSLLHTKVAHNKLQITSSDEMGFSKQNSRCYL